MTRLSCVTAVCVAAVFLAAAGFGDVAAAAPSADSAVAVDVVAGFDGHAEHGSWLPVTVTLTAERPFAGTLEVGGGAGGGALVQQRDVEVPAGSRKLYRLVLPPTRSVTARVTGDADRLVRRATPRDPGPGGFLVGVLGGVPPTPPTVEAIATGRRVTFVPVDGEWLAHSDLAVDGIGTLVATAEQLGGLPGAAATNLARAVLAGLDLTVVADRPGPLSLGEFDSPATAAVARGGLLALEPAAGAWTLRPADIGVDGGDEDVLAAAAGFGRGRVAVVAAQLGEGAAGRSPRLWAHLLQPAGPGGGQGPDPVARMLDMAEQVLSAGDAEAPAVPWLAWFLAAYVAAVGPVNGVVLTRLRRRELAWVTVPAVTVVFGVGAFMATAASKPPMGIAAAAAYWVEGRGTELSLVAARAPTPGERRVVLDGSGWAVTARLTRAPPTVRDNGDTEIGMPLEALEVGTVVGRRPLDAAPPVEVDAVAGADGVEVTVRNTSRAPVENVTVSAAGAARAVGDLPAGASRSVTVGGETLPQLEPWPEPFAGVHDEREHVRVPGSVAALLRHDVMEPNPGMVWVVGATRGGVAGSAARIDGVPAGSDVTLVAVGTALRPASEAGISPFAVPRRLVALGGGHHFSPTAVEGADTAVLRYRLPAGAGRVDALVSTLDRGWSGPGHVPPPVVPRVECRPGGPCVEVVEAVPVGPGICAPGEPCPEVEVWDSSAGAWVGLDDAFPDGRGDPARLLTPLGEVYVRGVTRGMMFEFSARGVAATAERRPRP